MIIAITLS